MGRVQLFPCEAEQDKTICWVRTGVPWVGSELVSGHTMESKFGIRFFVFCSVADVTVGTRHLCAGECAGELNHGYRGKRHMCSFAWFSWFPLHRAQLLGAGAGSRGCELILGSAQPCSWSSVQIDFGTHPEACCADCLVAFFGE